MIEIQSLTKRFGDRVALEELSCTIEDGSIFGLVGPNGSGKSTLLRSLAGVYYPDGGRLLIDGQPVFENPAIKERLFFVPDFPYFFRQSTLPGIAKLYRALYPAWDEARFAQLNTIFPLPPKLRLVNMSKGMQRQAALILALSTRPKVLLLDEIFDGLDPMIRLALKRLLFQEAGEQGCTIVVASHNLRELEDLCDHVGLLHQGKIVFAKDLDTLKQGIHKIQVVYSTPLSSDALEGLDIIKQEKRGSMYNFVIRGEREEIMRRLNSLQPVFLEVLPLSLEEVFLNEMEVVGYDPNRFIPS